MPNSVQQNARLFNLRLQADGALEQRSLMGTDYIVVPVVALVEGVLHPVNAPAPELVLAEEFGQHPGGWNGRPVVMGHPQIGQDRVSANIPAMLEQYAFGMLFNTRVEDKKLKTEAWINPSRAEQVGPEAVQALGRIKAGELVEVSTGLYMNLEGVNGEHDGQSYSGIWRNIVPDHLAILAEGDIGACSVEGGCGTNRSNSANSSIKTNCGQTCKCKGASMPAPSQEAAPVAAETKSKKTISASFKPVLDTLMQILKPRQNAELSDSDIRALLSAALDEKIPDSYVYVVAVYKDRVVYVVGEEFFSRGYSIDNMKVSLADEVTQVSPVTTFDPITDNQEKSMPTPADKDLVAKVLASNKRFTEEDRRWLEGLTGEQLGKLIPEEAPSAQAKAPETPTDLEGFVKLMPPEIAARVNEGVALVEARRTAVIKDLMARPGNEFKEDELKVMQMSVLERMAKLGGSTQPVDYSGAAPAPRANAGQDDYIAPAPMLVFEKKSA